MLAPVHATISFIRSTIKGLTSPAQPLTVEAVNRKVRNVEDSYVSLTDEMRRLEQSVKETTGNTNLIKPIETFVTSMKEDIREIRIELRNIQLQQQQDTHCAIPDICMFKDGATGVQRRACVHAELDTLREENAAIKLQPADIMKLLEQQQGAVAGTKRASCQTEQGKENPGLKSDTPPVKSTNHPPAPGTSGDPPSAKPGIPSEGTGRTTSRAAHDSESQGFNMAG